MKPIRRNLQRGCTTVLEPRESRTLKLLRSARRDQRIKCVVLRPIVPSPRTTHLAEWVMLTFQRIVSHVLPLPRTNRCIVLYKYKHQKHLGQAENNSEDPHSRYCSSTFVASAPSPSPPPSPAPGGLPLFLLDLVTLALLFVHTSPTAACLRRRFAIRQCVERMGASRRRELVGCCLRRSPAARTRRTPPLVVHSPSAPRPIPRFLS